MIHLDVMDGKFVPNTTFFADTIRKLRPLTNLPFDVHLMIEDPLEHIQEYIDARCDIVTVHAEACTEDSFSVITSELLKNGISPGIAINPSTNIPALLSPSIKDRCNYCDVCKSRLCWSEIHTRNITQNENDRSGPART